MPYRLRTREPIDSGVRRIAAEQVELALADLDPAGADRVAAVHRARRRVKRVRALLRLVRPALGESFRGEDVRFRDAARLLATSRDAAVAVQTYDALVERYRGEADPRRLGPVRRELTLRHRALALRAGGVPPQESFRITLARAGESAADWKLGAGGFGAVAGGLRGTYRAGRRAMRAAYRKPTDERFHEWRQQVRYHELHCALLRGVWRPVVGARRAEAERLAELLGAEHDLSVLEKMLRADPAAFGGSPAVEPLLGLVARRRLELRARARPLGRRLYAERPAALERRFRSYWKARRAERPEKLALAGRPARGARAAAGKGERSTAEASLDVAGASGLN